MIRAPRIIAVAAFKEGAAAEIAGAAAPAAADAALVAAGAGPGEHADIKVAVISEVPFLGPNLR